jgi:gamma-glutamyltranspeptidase/glutathione hydrolase
LAVRGPLLLLLSWCCVQGYAIAAPARVAGRGMVAAEHPRAAQAGATMLEEGGNAVDAAVAAAFAVCVANPSSCGIGGGGFAVVYDARERRVVALDFRETAPAALRQEMFWSGGKPDPRRSQRGGLAVGVPGEVAGLAALHRRFGRLPWKVVLEPAIRLARDGFAIGDHLGQQIAAHAAELRSVPELARVFVDAKGAPRGTGDWLVQPALARTLTAVANDGPEVFYRGPIARAIADAVQRAGGVLSEEDLAGYRPKWREPVSAHWRGFRVFSMPPPSSGGGVLLAALGILEEEELRDLGHNSPTYLHLLAETLKHVFADRARFYGDPDFVFVPLDRLLAPRTLGMLRRRISATRTYDPQWYGSAPLLEGVEPRDAGTAHLSVLDEEGNAVACTTTINTAFGAMLVAGDTGVLLNNEIDDFALAPGVANAYGLVGAEPNRVAPNKRPLSSMTPTLVLAGSKPVLAIGGSGGPTIISGTLQVLLNILAFGFDAEMAVAAARIHHQWQPPVLFVEQGIAPEVRAVLERNGHTVKEGNMGAVQVVRRIAGGFEGAADPRKGGAAEGW